jgi:hypothetical protein
MQHPCSEVTVQWVTRDKGQPAVRWGTHTGLLNRKASGGSITYARGDMCGSPANTTGWLEPGWLHAVSMSGLQPGRRYWYQYGDEVSWLLRRLSPEGNQRPVCGVSCPGPA